MWADFVHFVGPDMLPLYFYLCISTDRLWWILRCAFLLTCMRGFPVSPLYATPTFLPHILIHPDTGGAQIPCFQDPQKWHDILFVV